MEYRENDCDCQLISRPVNAGIKQQTGTSPHAFVNSIRLQQGALLLKQTADSVLSVALSVGFQSETHFGKAFKKQYGISPGQYRKNDRADEAAEQAEEMPIYL